MLPVIPLWVHFAVLAAMLIFALRCGGREEKLAATYYTAHNLLMVAICVVLRKPTPPGELIFLLIEAAFFTVLVLRGDKYWTLAVCSLCYLEVVTAAANMLRPATIWAYGTAQLVWFYGICGSIAAGTWLSWRRRTAGAMGRS